jgi:TetR/AcrR family transcriptional regulator of autoinduction and epiphytic fitness
MITIDTPRRMTDRKRAAVIGAAIEEFLAAGYDATSMDRIAARASVSKRTVYNHFPSKEALFAAILQQLWESSEAGEAPVYAADAPLRDQLLHHLSKKLTLLNDEAFLSLARVVWIRAATEDGRLRTSDPVFASQQLQGLVKAFAFWPQVTMGQPPLTEDEQRKVAESAADMFLARYA